MDERLCVKTRDKGMRNQRQGIMDDIRKKRVEKQGMRDERIGMRDEKGLGPEIRNEKPETTFKG